jgi:hypothetical protein
MPNINPCILHDNLQIISILFKSQRTSTAVAVARVAARPVAASAADSAAALVVGCDAGAAEAAAFAEAGVAATLPETEVWSCEGGEEGEEC